MPCAGDGRPACEDAGGAGLSKSVADQIAEQSPGLSFCPTGRLLCPSKGDHPVWAAEFRDDGGVAEWPPTCDRTGWKNLHSASFGATRLLPASNGANGN